MLVDCHIVKETTGWLLVNKPGGIAVNDEAMATGLVTLLSNQRGEKLHPVHRLDKDTTGLLLLARTPEANAVLSAQFQLASIQKTYLALSDKKPSKKQGWVKGDMEKGRGGSWLLRRSMQNPAITRFESFSVEPGLRGFVLYPQTGKTHQLRVALKSLSAPIIGDRRYGSSDADRLYLHAWQLAFDWQGERLAFQCDPVEGLWAKLDTGQLNAD